MHPGPPYTVADDGRSRLLRSGADKAEVEAAGDGTGQDSGQCMEVDCLESN